MIIFKSVAFTRLKLLIIDFGLVELHKVPEGYALYRADLSTPIHPCRIVPEGSYVFLMEAIGNTQLSKRFDVVIPFAWVKSGDIFPAMIVNRDFVEKGPVGVYRSRL